MNYAFDIKQKPGYLHAQVSGPNDPQTVRQYLRDVYLACQRVSCPNVLIEENLDGPVLSLADIYEIASQHSQNVWPVVKRVAFVDVNPAHDFTRMAFAETVAVNRGLNIRIFPKIQDAESWLLQEIKENGRS